MTSVDWDPLTDTSAPLKQKEPTLYRVTVDLFSPQAPDERGDLRAEVFGVMAVAGAVGKFHREEDGVTEGGAWTNGLGEKVPLTWPNMLSGPHTFLVETAYPLEVRRLGNARDWRQGTASAAYRWANDRSPAAALSDAIENGALWPLPNVWIVATARTQADVLAAGHLAHAPAAKRVLVCQPTEELCLREEFGLYEPESGGWALKFESRWAGSPDWVIVRGGDTPMHPDWLRQLRDQCVAADVPFRFETWGHWVPAPWKLPRVENENDDDYKERSEAQAATHGFSAHGELLTLEFQPWSAMRAAGPPPEWVGVRQVERPGTARLDRTIWDQFPEVPA